MKSVIVTEAFVDPLTGKLGEARLVSRVDLSRDAGVAETTLYSSQSPTMATSRFITYYEHGRVMHGVELAADGSTVSTTKCSYDSQGRLTMASTESRNVERTINETYEYGSGSIQRRAKTFTGVSIRIQTIDTAGRITKEEVIDEQRSVVDHVAEYTYIGSSREDVCRVYSNSERRYCVTTIRDAHGNDVEVRAEGNIRRIALEYDSMGNWVTKRTSMPGSQGTSLETIVQRKIEYW